MGIPAKKLKIAEQAAGRRKAGNVHRLAPSKAVERRNTELVSEYQRAKDPSVLEDIMQRNQGLLHSIIRRFSSSPEPYEDLLQVASVGLIKAVQRFDVSKGFEFSSYATAIIDGEVRHYLRDNVLIRQPRWLRKTKSRIDKASAELTRKLNRPPRLSELSKEVNIPEEGILEVFRVYATVGLHPVDDPVNRDEFTLKPDLSVMRSRHYESFVLPLEDEIIIHQALDALSSLHKRIIFMLYFRDMTQSETAEEMGMSQRKVSRESGKALQKLKAILGTKLF